MIKLSAVIITFNEEEHLEKCLFSIKSIVDEIIVIDSFSTDSTRAICEKFNVTFIEQMFLGYKEQKNFAITKASHDYILSLDGDEALSEELQQSVLALKQNWKLDGYYTNRRNNYCGQWIKHSNWYPDKKIRLFKKGKGEWKGINPHDCYTVFESKKVGKVKGDILHWVFRDYSEHQQKINSFSTIAAESYFRLDIKSTIGKIIFRPIWAFSKSYIFRLGFLGGLNGLVICVQTFNLTFMKYIKLYRLQQKEKNKVH
jgi:glycosyltransferase involved in cell wall biosynthesis